MVNVTVAAVPTILVLLIVGNAMVGAAVNGIVMVVEPVTVAVNVAFQPVEIKPVSVTNAPVAKLCAEANVIVPRVNAVLMSALLTAGNVIWLNANLPFQPDGVKPDNCNTALGYKLVGLAWNNTVPTLPDTVALITAVLAFVPPVRGPVNVVPSQL